MVEKLPEASPDYFLAHGASSQAEAAELARQAGWQAPEGSTGSYQPASAAPPARAPLSPVHESRVVARAAEFAKFPGVDAAQARSLAEQEFAMTHGSGPDRSAMAHQLAAGQTEEAIVESIDAGMEPPSAAHDYVMPATAPQIAALAEEFQRKDGLDAHSARINAERVILGIDSEMRQAMFHAGIPIAMGNAIARQLDETARHLLDATEEQVVSYCAENEQTLRRMWGGQFQQRYDTVRRFLVEQGGRSPILKELISNQPELFSHWSVADALARLAESQGRIGAEH